MILDQNGEVQIPNLCLRIRLLMRIRGCGKVDWYSTEDRWRDLFGVISGLYHIFENQFRNEAWAVPSRRYLKKSSTESRSDLNFGGERPGVRPRGYAQNLWQNV
jgi:hypothetical protein